MAIFDEKQGFLWVGIAIGAGAMLLVRGMKGPLAEVARSLTKASLKLSLDAVERAREGAAHLHEVLEDLLAEIHAERDAREEKRHKDARRRWAEDGRAREARS